MILEVDSNKYRELLIDNEAFRNIKKVIKNEKLSESEKYKEILNYIDVAADMKKEFRERQLK
ncbi:hypothetical protein [Bacillus infantis]|uniref:hypothetical protein n=1 Tax=Bacillus infantis TaxID=324767 RepID=UPI003CF9C029